jgi:hypothetical protein
MPQVEKKHEFDEVQVNSIRGFSRIPGMVFLVLIAAIGGLISGCTGGSTIWSTQSLSPDGKILAKASATATNGGLSVLASTDTNVILKWASGSRKEISVLELADASDTPVDTHVEMNWLTPTHLELTYRGNQTVVFQAVKWVDINITVRDLSSSATSNDR